MSPVPCEDSIQISCKFNDESSQKAHTEEEEARRRPRRKGAARSAACAAPRLALVDRDEVINDGRAAGQVGEAWRGRWLCGQGADGDGRGGQVGKEAGERGGN